MTHRLTESGQAVGEWDGLERQALKRRRSKKYSSILSPRRIYPSDVLTRTEVMGVDDSEKQSRYFVAVVHRIASFDLIELKCPNASSSRSCAAIGRREKPVGSVL
jgi:hypothetical protein